MNEEKKVWICREVLCDKLEDTLNELADQGYHIFKADECGIMEQIPESEPAFVRAHPTIFRGYRVIAFNQIELAKKLASDQVLQAIQQAGADALRNATAKEKKE